MLLSLDISNIVFDALMEWVVQIPWIISDKVTPNISDHWTPISDNHNNLFQIFQIFLFQMITMQSHWLWQVPREWGRLKPPPWMTSLTSMLVAQSFRQPGILTINKNSDPKIWLTSCNIQPCQADIVARSQFDAGENVRPSVPPLSRWKHNPGRQGSLYPKYAHSIYISVIF